MTLRLALILTAVVIFLTCSVFGVAVYVVSQPGVVNREARMQTLGSATGMGAGLMLAGIWIPYALAWKKKRDADRKASTSGKKKKRRRVEEDEDDE